MVHRIWLLCVVVAVWSISLSQVGVASEFKKGTPDLKTAGPLAFGPNGVLFVGDSKSAAIFAIDTGDAPKQRGSVNINVPNVDEKIAALLGTSRNSIQINDLAVNPSSGNAYVSVSRGRGPDAMPALFRVDSAGIVSQLDLKDVPFAKAALPNPPEDKVEVQGRRKKKVNKRLESVTDLAFYDGRLFIAGLSNEEFASKLRSIPYPFTSTDGGTSVEIFHASHGKLETHSPVRTFVPYDLGGEPHLLAAYTCTPLVSFPVSRLTPGTKVTGKTIAELGNHNRPLDMVVYQRDGKHYLLAANSARGVMKISTENIDQAEGLTEKVRDTAGQPYETIEGLKNVVQLDKLDDDSALILVDGGEDGGLALQTIPLP